jgi:NADH dehydrogenase
LVNRIVILGGGCGGLSVARALRFTPAQIILVDRQPSHLSQSRLYAAAVRGTNPSIPFATLLRGQKNVQIVRGEAVYLDSRQRRLVLTDRALPYDVLVVATGSRSCFGRDAWKSHAPALKSVDDARRVQEKLRDRDSTVVVVGGGVAGVELAAATAKVDRARRVVLVHEGERILPEFPENLALDATRQLERIGVEIRSNLHVTGIDRAGVQASGAQGREQILSRAVLWAGGVQGSEFGNALQRETGVPLDDAGRVCVSPDLAIPGHPEIFVIGDLARALHEGRPLETLGTVASQQGRHVASAIRERMAGYDAPPFAYVDQGRFALLGGGGVGLLGESEMRGTAAWLAARLAQKWSSPVDLIPQVYSAATASMT